MDSDAGVGTVIPISTHLVTVERPVAGSDDVRDPEGEGYDTPTDSAEQWEIVAEHVRAVIAAGGGIETASGETVQYTVLADPSPIDHDCRLTDEATGEQYQVAWAVATPGVAGQLASVRAGLTTMEGPGA